eukprot:1577646-Pleurochrysis_carterae.AAC.1
MTQRPKRIYTCMQMCVARQEAIVNVPKASNNVTFTYVIDRLYNLTHLSFIPAPRASLGFVSKIRRGVSSRSRAASYAQTANRE